MSENVMSAIGVKSQFNSKMYVKLSSIFTGGFFVLIDELFEEENNS